MVNEKPGIPLVQSLVTPAPVLTHKAANVHLAEFIAAGYDQSMDKRQSIWLDCTKVDSYYKAKAALTHSTHIDRDDQSQPQAKKGRPDFEDTMSEFFVAFEREFRRIVSVFSSLRMSQICEFLESSFCPTIG